uniref:Uncharacterized protein n=1 Tax=Vitis vinifera TaxID=29760 RepID=A5C6C8_VITVI|nr:hypothetical protein VITISV_043808 [Vitis vinifera]
MTHQPVTVAPVSVEKSKKYTRLIRETRVPTRIAMNTPREASWRGIGAFELSFERGREEEQAAARKRVCFLYWGEEVLKLFGDCWRSSFLRGDFLWLGGLDREDSRELQREEIGTGVFGRIQTRLSNYGFFDTHYGNSFRSGRLIGVKEDAINSFSYSHYSIGEENINLCWNHVRNLANNRVDLQVIQVFNVIGSGIDSVFGSLSLARPSVDYGKSYTLQAVLVGMMGQSPHHSPRATQSPLVFVPQIPVILLQKPYEMLITNHPWMQVSSEHEDMCSEQGFPSMFTWGYGGKEVAAEGSRDNWKIGKSLQRLGKEFAIMKVLPSFRLARSCP